MSDTVLPSHEAVLKLCAAALPKPWYPKEYARTSGVPRDSLDVPLNELRLHGLIKLTDWEPGIGQGYVLTEFGEEVLHDPAQLAQLRSGLQQPPPSRPVAPEEASAAGPETAFERGERARNAFYHPEPLRVMPLLLLVNLLAFAASFAVAARVGVPAGKFLWQGDPAILHEVGALSSRDLVHGEWWRLLTCCFLHFGLLHLGMNMYALFVLGQIESLWGAPRYLFLYLASGLCGSCAAMLWNPPGENIVLCGASGAIIGLMTSLGAWVFMNRAHLPPQEIARWMPRFGLALMFVVGTSFLPGVSASAHFGGAAAGFILATLLHVQRVAQPPRRTLATVLMILLPILCVAAVNEAVEKDPRWQQIIAADQRERRQKAELRFKHEVVPAVDKSEEEYLALSDEAFIVCDKKPADRDAGRVKKLEEQLKTARTGVKKALEKLGDKPLQDEQLRSAQSAGKEYVQAIEELLDKFQQMLEKKTDWEKEERATAETNVKKTRLQWRDAKNSL